MGKLIHEIAKDKGLTPAELGRIGGKNGKGKYMPVRLTEKRRCTKKCQLWNVCPFKYISIQTDGKCALARAPQRARTIVKRMATGKESHFNELMTETMIQIYLDVMSQKGNLDKKMRFLKLMTELKKSIFGEKKIIEAKESYKDLLIALEEEVDDDKQENNREEAGEDNT